MADLEILTTEFEKNKDKITKTQIDRVTLNKDESEKVNIWLSQIKDSSKGFLNLTRSDLVNYLISAHAAVLSLKEIKKIRQANYSLIKHLNWITPQLKKAIEEDNHDLILSLQLELRSLETGVVKNAESKNYSPNFDNSSAPKKQRVKKNNNKTSGDQIESNDF